MYILTFGSAQLIIPSHEKFESLNLQMFETSPKLLQFDWPFQMEAIRGCQKDIKN